MLNHNTVLSILVAIVISFVGCNAYGQIAVSTGNYKSDGKDISYELFQPTAVGPHPGVVILPGTFGLLPPWGNDIRSFGKGLAEKGIVAFIPNYFDSTDTKPGLETTTIITKLVSKHGAKWNTAIEKGIEYLVALSSVDGDRIGLLGFSLGGNRALTIAMQPGGQTKIQRIVEFFGPTTSIPLVGDVALLPKLQIHHGDDTDKIVPPSETKDLVRRLKNKNKNEGTDFQVFWYTNAGHGFKNTNLKSSRKETIAFFKGL